MDYDFPAKLAEADALLTGRHYSQAYTTTGGILEALLKRVYQDAMPRLTSGEATEVQAAAQRIGKDRPVADFTLGQLLNLYRDTKLADKAERALKRPFPHLKAANLYGFLERRNQATHEGAGISKAEAEAFLTTVRLLVEEAGLIPSADTPTAPSGPLKPWRHVIVPHPDVQAGRYQQAEFAADLNEVRARSGSSEYSDPYEFFRRTYLTAGMQRLLSAALHRLHGRGEAPVVQLKTAFGGGKTHTLIALYHLLKSPAEATRVASVRDLVAAAGGLPAKTAVAVIVGTHFSPTNPSRTLDDIGIEIHTLWGEIAAQLGGLDGYRMVADADTSGVNPGAAVLIDLLRHVGPCVILIDELVAFMRAIEHPTVRVRAGSLSTNLTFLQSLTEAVRAVPTAMLIASIPESDEELGGAAGRSVLKRVEKVIGRMEEIWEPVEVQESFEVVRRRLFGPVDDEAARDQVVAAFARLYRDNRGDFPAECREGDYERRMRASYPIHPEVFDRLYDDWASLERFQRTRGVLRLMAKVIHELWRSDAGDLLITPGALPIEAIPVRNELTRYLGDQWNSVVDSDVNHAARDLDAQVPRMQAVHASHRLARAVFLGSVPDKAVKGIDDVRLKLAVAQPAEPGGLSVYVDALQRMRDSLTFLYTTTQGRYWFNVQANLNRTVADRTHRLTPDNVADELDRRVKDWPTRDSGFAGVHLIPADSDKVEDVDRARLVVLAPSHGHRRGDLASDALRQAADLLDHRGVADRRYRNMLIFLAADASDWSLLDVETRRYLAWQSVYDERASLNLDRVQEEQALKSRDTADKTLDDLLRGSYRWLLNPYQEGINPVEWEPTPVTGSHTDPLKRASLTARSSGYLIPDWSPVALRHEFDRYLWTDNQPHLSVKTLWQQLATYLYLPRLRDQEVLAATIRAAAASQDYFGYATSYDPTTDRYQGLAFGRQPTQVYIDDASVLVRRDLALAATQTASARTPLPGGASGAAGASVRIGEEGVTDTGAGGPGRPDTQPAPLPPPTHFHGRIDLDPLKLSSLARQINEEILPYLLGAGHTVTITLEIDADLPDGADPKTVQTVTENAHTLKFKLAEFE